MSLYHEAAAVLSLPTSAGGSLRTKVFGNKDLKSPKAQVYALALETCKWSPVLKEVIERSQLLEDERKVSRTHHVRRCRLTVSAYLSMRREKAHLLLHNPFKTDPMLIVLFLLSLPISLPPSWRFFSSMTSWSRRAASHCRNHTA